MMGVWTPWLVATTAAGAVNFSIGWLMLMAGSPPGMLPWVMIAMGTILIGFGPDILKLVGV
jgi:hypothetical protein